MEKFNYNSSNYGYKTQADNIGQFNGKKNSDVFTAKTDLKAFDRNLMEQKEEAKKWEYKQGYYTSMFNSIMGGKLANIVFSGIPMGVKEFYKDNIVSSVQSQFKRLVEAGKIDLNESDNPLLLNMITSTIDSIPQYESVNPDPAYLKEVQDQEAVKVLEDEDVEQLIQKTQQDVSRIVGDEQKVASQQSEIRDSRENMKQKIRDEFADRVPENHEEPDTQPASDVDPYQKDWDELSPKEESSEVYNESVNLGYAKPMMIQSLAGFDAAKLKIKSSGVSYDAKELAHERKDDIENKVLFEKSLHKDTNSIFNKIYLENVQRHIDLYENLDYSKEEMMIKTTTSLAFLETLNKLALIKFNKSKLDEYVNDRFLFKR